MIIALSGLVLQQWGLFLLPATLVGGVAATLAFYHAGLWLTRHPAAGAVERGATELEP